jgi:hypothetical protein
VEFAYYLVALIAAFFALILCVVLRKKNVRAALKIPLASVFFETTDSLRKDDLP